MIVLVMSALAEPTRLETIRLLADGSENCVREQAQKLRSTECLMSRHTEALKRVELKADRPDAWLAQDRMNSDLRLSLTRLVQAALGRDRAVREALV